MKMISRESIENITNYIIMLLLIGTGFLVRFGDGFTCLLYKAIKHYNPGINSYQVKRITNAQ